jgi:hypothetical protein
MKGRVYSVVNAIWAEAVANTEDVYVEITVPSGQYIRVLRVQANGSNGLNSGSRDVPIKLLMKITSVAVTPSATFGALSVRKRNPTAPAAGCTANGKIDIGASATAGTLDTLLDQVNYLPYMNYEWIDPKGVGWLIPGGKFFVVSLAENSTGGNSRTVGVTWEEI